MSGLPACPASEPPRDAADPGRGGKQGAVTLTAPDRADGLLGGVQPLGGVADLLEQAAVYAAVRSGAGGSHRRLLHELVPVMNRQRVLAAVTRGLEAGWLVAGAGTRRARTLRTSDALGLDDQLVELLVAGLEHLVSAQVVVGSDHLRRLGLLSRRVVGL